MKVRYSYLKQQFSNCEGLWSKLKQFVATGDFTLGNLKAGKYKKLPQSVINSILNQTYLEVKNQ